MSTPPALMYSILGNGLESRALCTLSWPAASPTVSLALNVCEYGAVNYITYGGVNLGVYSTLRSSV